jgi:lysophospholipase L1-like esterase
MARSVIRPKQPAVTRVLPHIQNKKYAVPDSYYQVALIMQDSYGVETYATLDERQGFVKIRNADGGSTYFLTDANGGFNVLHGARMQAALDDNPEAALAVIMTTGVNDLTKLRQSTAIGGVTVADLQQTTLDITAQCVAANTLPIYSDIPLPNVWPPQLNGEIDVMMEFNAWISQYCADNGFQFIGIYNMFCAQDGSGIKPEWAQSDGVHLNDKGDQVLADMTLECIKTSRAASKRIPVPESRDAFYFDGSLAKFDPLVYDNSQAGVIQLAAVLSGQQGYLLSGNNDNNRMSVNSVTGDRFARANRAASVQIEGPINVVVGDEVDIHRLEWDGAVGTGTTSYYINDELQGSVATGAGTADVINMGARSNPDGTSTSIPWTGVIANFGYWIGTTDPSGGEATANHYYKMDEGANTTFFDSGTDAAINGEISTVGAGLWVKVPI